MRVENSFISKNEKKKFVSLTVADNFYTSLGYNIEVRLHVNSVNRLVKIEAKTVEVLHEKAPKTSGCFTLG